MFRPWQKWQLQPTGKGTIAGPLFTIRIEGTNRALTATADLELIAKAEEIAKEKGVRHHKGVYFGGPGPTYETPAEVRFYRLAGADVLGMSTIPEVIVARHCGIRVFGMSVITNKCNTDNVTVNHNDGEDVVRAADAAADRMCGLFTRLIATL